MNARSYQCELCNRVGSAENPIEEYLDNNDLPVEACEICAEEQDLIYAEVI